MRRLLLSVIAMSAFGCTEYAELEITHFKRPCYTFGQQMCLVYREGPNEPWYHLEDFIGGFNPEWQTEYVVEVEVDYESVYFSRGDYRYFSLSEVKSEKDVAAGTTFEIDLSIDHLVPTSTMTFVLGEQRDVLCDTRELCDRAQNILRSGSWFPGLLRHPDTPDQPLLLLDIKR